MKLMRLTIIWLTLISNSLLFVYGEELPSVGFSFSSNDCSVGPMLKESETGVKKVNWSNNALEVKVLESTNCADWIENGGFEIHDDLIVLKYIVGYRIFNGERLVAECMCSQELNYVFANLQKKNYRFEVKVEERLGLNQEKKKGK